MKERQIDQKEDRFKVLKRLLIVVEILLVVFIVGARVIIFKDSMDTKKRMEALQQEKEFLNMKIGDIKVEEDDGIYIFTAKIVNTSNKKFNKERVQFIFTDESGQLVRKFPYVISDLDVRDSQDIVIKTREKLTDFQDFEVKAIK